MNHAPKTIDITPTWTSVLPILIAALQDGTTEGKRLAVLELRNMARVADICNTIGDWKDLERILAKAKK